MVYPDNIEQKIDFLVIRHHLSSLCSSPLGRERVDAMQYSGDFERVGLLLRQAQEMLHIQHDASLEFPRGEIHDLRESLSRIRVAGLFLDEPELHSLRQSLDYAAELETFFAHLDIERFPVLHGWHSGHATGVEVIRLIDRVLDRFGQMRDSASPELARIRRELTQSQGSVSRAIHQILRQAQADGLLPSDAAPTMREGRLVLPVPPAMRRKIGGIVHDESATGKTIFVEPASVVEANNRIRQLESEERRERARILIEITDHIRPSVPDILATSDYLGEVDFLRAKAALAHQLDAIAPELVNKPIIHWQGARHSVLYLRFLEEKREVVPLDLHLDQEQRILVISGPNAGGKSVCLKTVALTQYMLQCGLLVPMSESSKVGMFDQLFIDIGDEQSISDDLSTYSSHLRNMKYFLRNADGKTLFLIDEFGSGTEPLIGGAIAEATLVNLHKAEALGVVTTHYSNLKHLAETTPGIVNGAMLYDRGALRPMFRLSIGQAGSSFAVEIAHQIGLPDDIIDRAKELVGSDYIDYDRSLQDIARDRRYWENKRQAIRQREKHLEEKIAYYEQEISGLKQQKKAILQEANQQAADILEQSNATIERTIREIKESKADKERTRQARRRVDNLKQRVGAVKQPNVEPTKAEKQPHILRDFRDLKSLSSAKLISETPSPQGSGLQRSVSTIATEMRKRKLSFSRELDLRGLRADEALEQLVAYIDSAIMVNAGTVTILHGTGTGALKQLTRDYLSSLNRKKVNGKIVTREVVRFRDGDPDRGGAGLTIVEL